MTRRTGTDRPGDDARDGSVALQRAAMQQFAARGYEATRLRQIAGAAGVDVALIAYHFGGKLGLWKAVVASAAADLHAELDHAIAQKDEGGAAARLRRTMSAYIGHLLGHPEVPRLILRDTTIDNDRSEWLLRELSAPLHQRFHDLAQAAFAHGAARKPHLQFRVANFIYSAASHVARRERLTRLVDDIPDEQAFASALETLLIDEALRCG